MIGGGRVIGVVKAYTTRVGEGPFPTEFKTNLKNDDHKGVTPANTDDDNLKMFDFVVQDCMFDCINACSSRSFKLFEFIVCINSC